MYLYIQLPYDHDHNGPSYLANITINSGNQEYCLKKPEYHGKSIDFPSHLQAMA